MQYSHSNPYIAVWLDANPRPRRVRTVRGYIAITNVWTGWRLIVFGAGRFVRDFGERAYPVLTGTA